MSWPEPSVWEHRQEYEAICRIAKAIDRGESHWHALAEDGLRRQDTLIREITRARELHAQVVDGIDTLAGNLNEVRDTVRVGFDGLANSINDGFARLERSLLDSLSRIGVLLCEISTKVEWTEGFKQFIKLKRNAFNLARLHDFQIAVEQGIEGLDVHEASGGRDDDIYRDPELNALVAKLLVEGRAQAPKINPIELAKRAFDRGQHSKVQSELQAASDGAHLLAVAARGRGDFVSGADWDMRSYSLEQQDKVAGLARVYAALALSEDTMTIARAVALASIVHPRFIPLWLSQPALISDRERADAVVKALHTVLEIEIKKLNAALTTQVNSWRVILVQSNLDPPALTDGVGSSSKEESVIILSAKVRAGYSAVLKNEDVCLGDVLGLTNGLISRAKTIVDAHNGRLIRKEIQRDSALSQWTNQTPRMFCWLIGGSIVAVIVVASVRNDRYPSSTFSTVCPISLFLLVLWLLGGLTYYIIRPRQERHPLVFFLEECEVAYGLAMQQRDVRKYMAMFATEGVQYLLSADCGTFNVGLDNLRTFGDHLNNTSEYLLSPTLPGRAAIFDNLRDPVSALREAMKPRQDNPASLLTKMSVSSSGSMRFDLRTIGVISSLTLAIVLVVIALMMLSTTRNPSRENTGTIVPSSIAISTTPPPMEPGVLQDIAARSETYDCPVSSALGHEWAETVHEIWVGRQFSYSCPRDGRLAAVYGSGPYSTESSVCSAAVHAGRIRQHHGGRVVIEILSRGSCDNVLVGSRSNGVVSSGHDIRDGCFFFSDHPRL